MMSNDNRQRASLNARLVVCCETIAQLRGAELVRPEVAEDHAADETGEKRMESRQLRRSPGFPVGEAGPLNSRNMHPFDTYNAQR